MTRGPARRALVALVALPVVGLATPSAASGSPHGSPCLLRVSSPYSDRHPLRFPLYLSLGPKADLYEASAPFVGIVVRDLRGREKPWTLVVRSSPLRTTSPVAHQINAIDDQNVGLVDLSAAKASGAAFDTSAKNLALRNNAPAAPPVPAGTVGTRGLGGRRHVVATARRGRGVVTLSGTLRVVAPTSTPPGSYTGNLTFRVGCSTTTVPVQPPHHHRHHHHHPGHPHHGPTPSPSPTVRVLGGGGQHTPPSQPLPSGSGSAGGAGLPFTGLPALALTAAGLLVLLDGVVLTWFSRRRRHPRHIVNV